MILIDNEINYNMFYNIQRFLKYDVFKYNIYKFGFKILVD